MRRRTGGGERFSYSCRVNIWDFIPVSVPISNFIFYLHPIRKLVGNFAIPTMMYALFVHVTKTQRRILSTTLLSFNGIR